MSHLPVAVVGVDADGVVRVWNEAAAALYGCSVDGIIGSVFTDLFETGLDDEAVTALVEQVERGDLWEGEICTARLDGSRLDLHAVIAPVFDGGVFTGFVTTVLDSAADDAMKGALDEWRSFAEASAAVLDAERDRVARELHDDLGQCLTAVRSELLWLRSLPHDRHGEVLERVDGLLSGGIDSIRRICDALRPRLVDEVGVCGALESLADAFERRTGITCTSIIDHDRLGWITPEAEVVIYRVAQEGLTNIERHAGAATHVVLELTTVDGAGTLSPTGAGGEALALIVTNDGTAYGGDRGFGIVSMEQRARSLRGHVEIAGDADMSTTLTLTIPASAAFTVDPRSGVRA